MFLNKMEKIIWQYRRLIILLLVVVVIQFFELALLYYKYNIFTGGFLQPFSYQTIYDRLVFISLSFWFDCMFFGLIATVWFFVADKINKHGVIVYYNYAISTLLIMGGWLGFKFKVLSYFNDTLNFQIIQSLGGGSLKEALLYVSNEIFLFASVVFLVIIFFIISSKFLRKIDYSRLFTIKNKKHTLPIQTLVTCFILTTIMALFISNNEVLRYGMQKKTSYYLISEALDRMSDVDFDGFGSFSFPQDKNIFNANIYPGALDIPGNGIDEDGFLGDASSLSTEIDSLSEITPEKGKHIVLIVLESARADLLEKKIKGNYVAPIIRGIAKTGFFVKNAYSHTGYTTTSIKAIFNRSLISRNKKITLIDFLQTAGYQMSIISGQDESFGNVALDVGMKQNGVYYFDARSAINDRVFVSKEPGSLRLSEERVVEQFKLRIAQLDFIEPQFIYLNFQAAHFPYSHPKMTKRITQNLIARSEISFENKIKLVETYWNAIANADWAIGEVIEVLKQRQTLENTTIVILGDHGESLFDDGFLGHGHAVNDSQTKIPLIINDPDIVVNEPIGQVDVAEIIVRSALELKNQWDNKDKVVFQLVGNLNRPLLIAHVKNEGQRTLFDFRTEQVFFSEVQLWKPYKEAIDDSDYKERVENLIRDWEDLRWKAHLARRH